MIPIVYDRFWRKKSSTKSLQMQSLQLDAKNAAMKVRIYLDCVYNSAADLNHAMALLGEAACGEQEDGTEMLKQLYECMQDTTNAQLLLEKRVSILQSHVSTTTDIDALLEQLNSADLEQQVAASTRSAMKKYRQSLWDVVHSGETMPDDEDRDSDSDAGDVNILQARVSSVCPITRQEMIVPMTSEKCGHSISQQAMQQYFPSRTQPKPCPVAGCSQQLLSTDMQEDRVLKRTFIRQRFDEKLVHADTVMEL